MGLPLACQQHGPAAFLVTLPVTERFVTAALVSGRTGLTVRVVAALLVTRLGVVAT